MSKRHTLICFCNSIQLSGKKEVRRMKVRKFIEGGRDGKKARVPNKSLFRAIYRKRPNERGQLAVEVDVFEQARGDKGQGRSKQREKNSSSRSQKRQRSQQMCREGMRKKDCIGNLNQSLSEVAGTDCDGVMDENNFNPQKWEKTVCSCTQFARSLQEVQVPINVVTTKHESKNANSDCLCS